MQFADAKASPSSRSVSPIVAEAVAWMVNLNSGEVTDNERSDFAVWYGADAAHREAWDRLAASVGWVDVVRKAQPGDGEGFGRRIVEREMSRRRLVTTAVFGGAAVASAGLLDRVLPLSNVLADQTTWTGERRSVALAGGGIMILGPRSAANVRVDANGERISLLSGDLLVKVDEPRRLPVEITVDDWLLTPARGRVSVHRDGSSLSMAALHAPVSATIAGRRLVVEPSQALSRDNGVLREWTTDAEVAAAWASGLLIIRDGQLSSLIQALHPYFTGIIRVSPAAAAVRVAGVFDLSKPHDTLVSLAESFPITVRRVTPFWLSVDVAA